MQLHDRHKFALVGQRTLRVLLVEDCIEDAVLVLDELRLAGYELEHERIETELALRQALNAQSWDLLLCDYAMPTFDALSALAVLKELRLDLPFIMVSGVVGEEAAVSALKAGAHDFVVKDKLARLVPAIERELREAAVRKESSALREQLLLSDRLVQIGTLAASVAHEINNPLTYVMGNLSYAIDALTEAEPSRTTRAELVEVLRQALEGAARIRNTAADLRVFSRSDEREPQPVELRRVLDSSIGMAWTQIRHRAQLIKDFKPVPPIVASENRLGQVFLNLLINAAQAIPEDGTSADQTIQVSLWQSGNMVEISVRDTGVGIRPELTRHLFEPFFTTKPKGVGTGLGLSICRRIVHEYGGQITLRANPDRGATASVRLPIGVLAAPEIAPARTTRPGMRRGRIMIIDDEPVITESLARTLRLDHEVSGFTDARLALALLLTDSSFDVIVCDLMMPLMSGPEFHAALAQQATALLDRVVFITGGAFTEPARQFLDSVDNPRLQKPFPPRVLSELVREMIARLDARPPLDLAMKNRAS